MESAVKHPQELARDVARLIREAGVEVFGNAVRQVAAERVAVLNERHRREEARRELLRKSGVWLGHQKLPKPPGRGWCHMFETFRGTVKDRLDFDQLKARGFPSEPPAPGDKYEEYSAEVEGWVPPELFPDDDPPTYELLPIPNRGFTKAEKVTVLSAVHDAHDRGDEKVAPWGVSRKGDMPTAGPRGAERDECEKALWYYQLTCEAREVTSADASLMRDWLDEIRVSLQATVQKAEAVSELPLSVDETRLPSAPSSLAELPAWIESARKLLRDQEDQPIEETGIAYPVRKHFLEHLERLCPEWPGWYRTLPSQSFETVRGLVATMARVAQRVGGRPPAPTIVEGFAPKSAEPVANRPEARHSPDFRSVVWFGESYSFTANQAACVKILWDAWKNGTPEVSGAHLLEAADVQDSAQRIDLVFRGNPAWGALVVPGRTKGTYRLKEPGAKPAAKKTKAHGKTHT